MRIAIASDHAGFELKEALAHHLIGRGELTVLNLGPATADRCDYPDYAGQVARAVRAGECTLGILVCGSGIGVSICLLYTSPSPRDKRQSRMPSSA